MRFSRFMLTFFLLLNIAGANSKDSSWKLTLDENEVKVYQHVTNPDVTGSYQTVSNSSSQPPGINQENFIAEFSAQKRETLGFIGITQWQISSYKPTNDHKGFTLEGSYIDSSRTLIEFREEHIYQQSKIIQVLNTWPATYNAGKQSAEDFIKMLKNGPIK